MCSRSPVGGHSSGHKSGPGKPGCLRLYLPDRQHDQTAADGIRILFASVAIVAGGTILNALFGAALVNVQANSLTGLFSIAGFLLIYARVCTTLVAAVFALQAYLPDHVINFLGGRDGVNMLGNMVSSVKDIIAGGNTNMRRTPGVREEKLKNINGDDKDGIKQ